MFRYPASAHAHWRETSEWQRQVTVSLWAAGSRKAEQATGDNRRMRFACWITTARDTNLEYVIINTLPAQNGYANASKYYVKPHCPFPPIPPRPFLTSGFKLNLINMSLFFFGILDFVPFSIVYFTCFFFITAHRTGSLTYFWGLVLNYIWGGFIYGYSWSYNAEKAVKMCHTDHYKHNTAN
jgi:hypothetical protein